MGVEETSNPEMERWDPFFSGWNILDFEINFLRMESEKWKVESKRVEMRLGNVLKKGISKIVFGLHFSLLFSMFYKKFAWKLFMFLSLCDVQNVLRKALCVFCFRCTKCFPESTFCFLFSVSTFCFHFPFPFLRVPELNSVLKSESEVMNRAKSKNKQTNEQK